MSPIQKKRIYIFQIKCLRRILKDRWQQIIPNKIAMQMAWAENISGEEEEMELNKPCTLERLNGLMWCSPSGGRLADWSCRLWRWSWITRAGALGTRHAVQPQTSPCRRNMLNLCVPFSTDKIKDIVRGCTTWISFRRALIYGGPILFMQSVVCPFAWLLLSDSYFKLPTEWDQYTFTCMSSFKFHNSCVSDIL